MRLDDKNAVPHSEWILMKLFLLAILLIAPIVGCAGSNENSSISSSEVLSGIRDVVTHNDLSDVEYFSRKLGVIMSGGQKIEGKGGLSVCGLDYPPKISNKIVQRFYYEKFPDYFDRRYIGKPPCEFNYVREFAGDRIVKTYASAVFDVNKICISEADVKSALKEFRFENARGGFNARGTSGGQRGIAVELISTYAGPICVRSAHFSQE
ncbi:hypothetical protein [Burkholderia sp. Ac-20392]|uniref:hypothetical protein n=1 Tax=Burkholderia sp. Ac-20392 TaxID=2703905 RepID=UPI00197D1875|nr:hypothetical protein [Burkholderia sp. Ac-20392]MBN3793866.1 hypothetical protein [Burkholderia sp. Ac-20392]